MLLSSVLLLVYPVFVADEDEFLTMAQVRELLKVQESMLIKTNKQGLEGYIRDSGFDQNTVRESGKR